MLHAILIGLLAIFILTQVENSIAQKTADEIERRSRPKPQAPKSKLSSILTSPRLALIGSAIGVIGLLVVIGHG